MARQKRINLAELPDDRTVQCNTEAFRAALAQAVANGATWDSIAEEAQCNRSMINHLQRGRVLTCTAGLARRLEGVLGAKPNTLFQKPDEDVLWEKRGSRVRDLPQR
jgi:hypothetical protein